MKTKQKKSKVPAPKGFPLIRYKSVDTSTIAGVEQAEKLRADGWAVVRIGLWIIDFSKKD